MDAANLILTEPVTSPDMLPDTNKIKGASDEKIEQFAKDFESVFIGKIMDQMKNTVVEWGLEKDAASKQTQDIFWMCMAKDIGSKGGLGLWKDIYNSLSKPEQTNQTTQLTGEGI